MVLDYLLENWALILISIAFLILLRITVFLEKKTVHRLYILVGVVFLLSIIVFLEFYFSDKGIYPEVRNALIEIRYSATPIIIALILFTLVRKMRWFVFAPAIILAIINFISIFTGIVVSISPAGEMIRGPLRYLPYIGVGVYSAALVFTLYRQSNKRAVEIIPIIFLAFAFLSGLVFPFIVGKKYHVIFSDTIMIALFVYYVFSFFMLTSKDALTGLLNRQAFYSTIDDDHKTITGVISIDMNGLKVINDNKGHSAGDEALMTIASCLLQVQTKNFIAFRIGGDEFIIICKRVEEQEIQSVINKIKKNVSQTGYSCSIGYSYSFDKEKSVIDMVKESDEMMYEDKANHYAKLNQNK